MHFNPYPFERLRFLLRDITPKQQGLNLSIGEPAFNAPDCVVSALQENANLIRYYPSLQNDLIQAQIEFVQKRFHITLQENEIIPTFGSREVLFNFPHFIFCDRKYIKGDSALMAFPNPFYQIYEGAQIANHANVIYMPLDEANHFKPKLTDIDLQKVDMVILNSPNNPTGQILTQKELEEWVLHALKYNFILINDECYSEIYAENPPASLLEASIAVGNKEFKNIFVINSISKRLSAPGLRSGFIAGDSKILQEYKIFRTYVGISLPLTLQKASVVAWREHEYAELIRKKFTKNIYLAQKIFANSHIFPYTFYLWLQVQTNKDSKGLSSDEIFTQELYKNTGHLVLAGSYLGRNGSGVGYVRIALTQEEEIMSKALNDIYSYFSTF